MYMCQTVLYFCSCKLLKHCHALIKLLKLFLCVLFAVNKLRQNVAGGRIWFLRQGRKWGHLYCWCCSRNTCQHDWQPLHWWTCFGHGFPAPHVMTSEACHWPSFCLQILAGWKHSWIKSQCIKSQIISKSKSNNLPRIQGRFYRVERSTMTWPPWQSTENSSRRISSPSQSRRNLDGWRWDFAGRCPTHKFFLIFFSGPA